MKFIGENSLDWRWSCPRSSKTDTALTAPLVYFSSRFWLDLRGKTMRPKFDLGQVVATPGCSHTWQSRCPGHQRPDSPGVPQPVRCWRLGRVGRSRPARERVFTRPWSPVPVRLLAPGPHPAVHHYRGGRQRHHAAARGMLAPKRGGNSSALTWSRVGGESSLGRRTPGLADGYWYGREKPKS